MASGRPDRGVLGQDMRPQQPDGQPVHLPAAYAEQVDVDRQNRKVSALVEYASKADYRGGKPN